MIEHPYYESLGLKIDERSFRECYINPEPSGTSILQRYPSMNEWVEFRESPKKYPTAEVKNNAVLRYIVAMYDPQSPFKHLDYQTRKNCAAIFAGFKTNQKGDFHAQIQDILNGDIHIVNIMVIRYCAITRGLEWATYKQFERRYYEITLLDPDKKIIDIEKDKDVVAKYRDLFLAGDKTPELQKVFYKIVTDEEKELRKLRPEYQEQFFYNKIALSRAEIEKSYKKDNSNEDY